LAATRASVASMMSKRPTMVCTLPTMVVLLALTKLRPNALKCATLMANCYSLVHAWRNKKESR
jgi:hypothetical protein